MVRGEPVGGGMDYQTDATSRFQLRALDARNEFSARSRPAEAIVERSTGPGCTAFARSKLRHPISEQDRWLTHHDSSNFATRRDPKFPSRLHHSVCRGLFCS